MAKKKKMLTLDVVAISLVDAGANRKSILYKADGSVTTTMNVLKYDEKKGLVYGCVYEPDEVDTQGDYTDAETIAKACHAFAEKERLKNVDKQHDGETNKGVVVESFILKGSHPDYPNVKPDSWCVVIKVSEEMKALMSEVGGISLAGTATYEEVEETDKSATTDGRPSEPLAFFVSPVEEPLAKFI
jgi:hypothetical protein